MKKYYLSLADSVHYNREPAYIPYRLQEHAVEYAKALEEMLKGIRVSPDTQICFTLNQIVDNPIWFRNTAISKKLFDQLLKLLSSGKAFISTYKNYRCDSYALDRMVSAWKRISDTDPDDIRFMSSLIEELADIKGKVDPENEIFVRYSDADKRAAHRAMFGIDRLVAITEDGMVAYGNQKLPIEDYLREPMYNKENQPVFGYYNGLREEMKDEECLHTGHFLERIRELSRSGSFYVPNHPFASENGITLSQVVSRVLNDDQLLRRVYISTIDTAVEKRVHKKEKEFLSATCAAFSELKGSMTRSIIYENSLALIEKYLKPLLGYAESTYKQNAYQYRIYTFFFGLADFCYNYYNHILCFGYDPDAVFVFTPYHTDKGEAPGDTKPIDKKRERHIELTADDLFRIRYTLRDQDQNIVGYYLDVKSACEAKQKRESRNPDCQLFLYDDEGTCIPIK